MTEHLATAFGLVLVAAFVFYVAWKLYDGGEG